MLMLGHTDLSPIMKHQQRTICTASREQRRGGTEDRVGEGLMGAERRGHEEIIEEGAGLAER